MQKECPVCHNEFIASKITQKYCSKECGLVKKREADKLRKRKIREEDRVIRQQERQRLQQEKLLEKEEAERKHQETKERELLELQTKADNGDPVARMTLAKPFSVEYWEAYSDYEIENSLNYDNKPIRYVNGISVHEMDFAEKVMFTIEERGHILSELVTSKI